MHFTDSVSETQAHPRLGHPLCHQWDYRRRVAYSIEIPTLGWGNLHVTNGIIANVSPGLPRKASVKSGAEASCHQ